MVTFHKNITDFFDELLTDIECQRDTRAYITSIYGKFRTARFDLSKDSVTLLFAQGRDKQDFLTYQNLGDWLFYTSTLMPNYLQHASQEYYDTIARLSYYSCYRLINRQWRLFEELADRLPILEKRVKDRLINLNTKQTSAGIGIEIYGV